MIKTLMDTIMINTLRPLTRSSTFIVLLFGTTLALGCSSQPKQRGQRYNYAQIKMGVQARLVVYACDEATAENACRASYARVEALENAMSDYRRDSELLRLCAQAGGPPVKVSDDLFYILQKAQKFSQETAGAFDVTVGPEVALWRKARKTRQLPTPQEIAAARELTGWQMMHLDPRNKTVQLEKRGMKLDLGGIAKGYAGDEATRVLREHGITSALFEAGGDIVVSDAPPGTNGWTINIDHPAPSAPHQLTLHNAAISTSGDTVQFVEINNVKYSHVVDPRTGEALTNHYAATIIAPKGIDTDALSTALTVTGEQGMKLLPTYHARGWLRELKP
jgi:thiamine biosynthesis lipoprotein